MWSLSALDRQGHSQSRAQCGVKVPWGEVQERSFARSNPVRAGSRRLSGPMLPTLLAGVHLVTVLYLPRPPKIVGFTFKSAQVSLVTQAQMVVLIGGFSESHGKSRGNQG